ncbi:protein MRG1 isoform X1 [Lactuca sativa]|uniref:protein MRG1 isoform X1 n=1 Tax=Lactuca sativa TaxID=4236 RepID=UPI000CD7FC77|nr:protein MRG1 isoform X1 [Lactuca sativa]
MNQIPLKVKPRNQKEAGLSRATTLMGSSKEDSANGADNSAANRRRADSNSKLFSDGEKVLAYHGPRIYEAKVQKSEIRKNEWKYFVHYLGWSKTWDEWVGVDRLMKNTEENILKQQALDKKQGVDRNSKSGKSTQTKPKVSSGMFPFPSTYHTSFLVCVLIVSYYLNVIIIGAKGKKRKNDSSTEKENASVENLINIQIPSALKKQLVDDWEFVNEQDKLVELPRSPNIDDIFEKYLEYRSKKDGMMTDSVGVGEILKGLRCYFDRALPIILLYNKERHQYHEAVADDVSPSTIYGAEHLLRLFVKLPDLLPYVNIEEDLVTRLHQKFVDFLKFLQKNRNSFFVSSYDGSKVSD